MNDQAIDKDDRLLSRPDARLRRLRPPRAEGAGRAVGRRALPPRRRAMTGKPSRIWTDLDLDRDGKSQDLAAEGLLATCLQHEIDHLDGILFIDHISALKRNMILRKLLKARKEKERDEAESKPAKAQDPEHAL